LQNCNYILYECCYIQLMEDFTEFEALARCREFARGVAVQLNRGTFSKDLVLSTALRKTLLSIYSNFGEGFERDGNREFAQFLAIAKGSIGETRAQLIYALDFEYLGLETFSELDQLGRTATKCVGGLIRHLNNSSYRGRKFKQRDPQPSEPRSTTLHMQKTPCAEAQHETSPQSRHRQTATPNGERRTVNDER
jgi:four helix bundle protein